MLALESRQTCLVRIFEQDEFANSGEWAVAAYMANVYLLQGILQKNKPTAEWSPSMPTAPRPRGGSRGIPMLYKLCPPNVQAWVWKQGRMPYSEADLGWQAVEGCHGGVTVLIIDA